MGCCFVELTPIRYILTTQLRVNTLFIIESPATYRIVSGISRTISWFFITQDVGAWLYFILS